MPEADEERYEVGQPQLAPGFYLKGSQMDMEDVVRLNAAGVGIQVFIDAFDS
jgi:hypothetical protein